MERLKRRGVFEKIGNGLTRLFADRETLPTLNVGWLSDNVQETIPDVLSDRAKDIWGRREYGKRVNRAFKNYLLELQMPYLIAEEIALFRNLLAGEFIKDPKEQVLVARAKANGPVQSAYQEIIDFNHAQRRKLEQQLKLALRRPNQSSELLDASARKLNESLFRLARGIKIADMRDQSLEIKQEFVHLAVVEQEEQIIQAHQALGVNRI